jgi:NitT/TauT family transport system substrate-binding protein
MKLALDWIPNPTHCGIFTALRNCWASKVGIHFELLSPHNDDYQVTPADKLRKGLTHLAIIPPEELILDQLSGKNQFVPLRAILQYNVSSIATLRSSNISRPAMLDGKKYALLDIPYEKEIITQMVKADGGKGDIQWILAPKLQTYELLYNGVADAAWVFENIEGVEAMHKGTPFQFFKLEDYGVPYGPTTILAASSNAYELNQEEIHRTLSIIEAGYSLANIDPHLAIDSLYNHPLNVYYTNKQLLELCQKATKPYLMCKGEWGVFDEHKFQNYKSWVLEKCHSLQLY